MNGGQQPGQGEKRGIKMRGGGISKRVSIGLTSRNFPDTNKNHSASASSSSFRKVGMINATKLISRSLSGPSSTFWPHLSELNVSGDSALTRNNSATRQQMGGTAENVRVQSEALPQLEAERKSRELQEAQQRSQGKAQLREQVEVELREKLTVELRAQLEIEVRRLLRNELRPQLERELRTELRGELRNELRPQLEMELRADLGAELRDELRREMEVELRRDMDAERVDPENMAQGVAGNGNMMERLDQNVAELLNTLRREGPPRVANLPEGLPFRFRDDVEAFETAGQGIHNLIIGYLRTMGGRSAKECASEYFKATFPEDGNPSLEMVWNRSRNNIILENSALFDVFHAAANHTIKGGVDKKTFVHEFRNGLKATQNRLRRRLIEQAAIDSENSEEEDA